MTIQELYYDERFNNVVYFLSECGFSSLEDLKDFDFDELLEIGRKQFCFWVILFMADNHSKEVRSMNMSHIRSTNSKPEEIVRKYLFSQGFRYRKNVKKLPGCPDIVLPKYRTVIFVNGCFWHKHDCSRFVWPSSNQDYWRPKILRNVERDQKNVEELKALGWNVITVWECELKRAVREENLNLLVTKIQQSKG